MSTELSTALQNLSDSRSDIVTALAAQGATIDDSAGFGDFASAISALNVAPSEITITKLTPVTSTISQSEMFAVNVGTQTLVFGSFTKSSTGSSVFSYPETFTFGHTSTHTYWLYAANASSTSSSRSTSSYSYSVNTTNRQVTLYCQAASTKYYYTYWFY